MKRKLSFQTPKTKSTIQQKSEWFKTKKLLIIYTILYFHTETQKEKNQPSFFSFHIRFRRYIMKKGEISTLAEF